MFYNAGLTTARILGAFTNEVAARGGRVTDTFDDGQRLFTRSVLPHTADVQPGDTVRGGVALKANDGEVWLYPYIFRLVCQNGAIVAQTLETRHLADLHLLETDYALESVREGIEACCDKEVFADCVGRMRAATETEADLALNMLPLLARFTGPGNSDLLARIMDQFFRDGDRSRFGLANAVTATARDTRDPELKWNLEEFGGGIAVGMIPGLPRYPRQGAARPRTAVSVG